MEALTTANTEASVTKNSLESINEIRYDSFGDAMAGIGRQLETNIILPIGQKAVPVLTTFSQGLQLAIDHAGEIAPVLAGAAVTVGTFTAATNASAIAQKAQTMATTGVTVATKALNLAMNANPIVLVTTAALGLTAAFVTLYKTNEEFRNKVNETWNSLKNSAATVWTGIKTTFINGMSEAKEAVVNGFTSLPAQLKQAGQDAVAGLLSGLTSGAEAVVQNITGLGERAVNAFKEKLGIHSPSKVFQAIGNNIVEGLSIGVDEESGLAIQEITNLGTAILNTGDVISEGLITKNEKTGRIIYDSLYTGIMNRLSLYYKDRDARIQAMEDGTEENIAQINKEIEATRTATDIKIKLYQQEYAAKAALIDDETSAATKAIQAQIDAINAQQEADNRAEEEEAYLEKMAELQEKYDTSETEEEKAQLEAQINEQIKAREKKLLQQQRQDEIAALRQQMEEAEAAAAEAAAAEQEEAADPAADPTYPGRYPYSGASVLLSSYTEEQPYLAISAYAGGTVTAAGDGTVVAAGSDEIYQHIIEVAHESGYKTRYLCHQSAEISVEEGSAVQAGDILLTITTDETQLDYQVIYEDAPIDPLSVIDARG